MLKDNESTFKLYYDPHTQCTSKSVYGGFSSDINTLGVAYGLVKDLHLVVDVHYYS